MNKLVTNSHAWLKHGYKEVVNLLNIESHRSSE
jgi:hypothetical protein